MYVKADILSKTLEKEHVKNQFSHERNLANLYNIQVININNNRENITEEVLFDNNDVDFANDEVHFVVDAVENLTNKEENCTEKEHDGIENDDCNTINQIENLLKLKNIKTTELDGTYSLSDPYCAFLLHQNPFILNINNLVFKKLFLFHNSNAIQHKYNGKNIL